tara:strand:+ start:230 stop:331 length:102 start_codon:yes stop_codon:yes gene_type:complete
MQSLSIGHLNLILGLGENAGEIEKTELVIVNTF